MRAATLKLRLSFDGSFDHEDALRAAGQLEGSVRGALVSLDFAHCAKVDPASLAHLTGAITGQGASVELLGLSRHDRRILNYLVGPLDSPLVGEELSD